MSSFFSSGKVDTTRFDRKKLPALKGTRPDGKDATAAIYRVRLTDVCDHIGANGGDRTQFNASVISGPLAGKVANELVMHDGYAKAWMKEKARGTCAIVLGAFAGFTADQSGFKVDNAFFAKHGRTVTYDGNTVKSSTRASTELPLVQSEAEAFLVVTPYFDKKTGTRKVNPKTRQLSVTYEFLPLSANLAVSESGHEGQGDSVDEGEDDVPEAPEAEEPQVDALAQALADGWRVNPNAPAFYFKKGEAKQHKEAALRALYSK